MRFPKNLEHFSGSITYLTSLKARDHWIQQKELKNRNSQPVHLHFIWDFQNYLENFSSLNIKEVTKRQFHINLTAENSDWYKNS